MSGKAKAFITELFKISGITINGSKPYDITINNENFYDRIVKHGANPRNAKTWVDEHYTHVSKYYKGVAKIAEVIMYL